MLFCPRGTPRPGGSTAHASSPGQLTVCWGFGASPDDSSVDVGATREGNHRCVGHTAPELGPGRLSWPWKTVTLCLMSSPPGPRPVSSLWGRDAELLSSRGAGGSGQRGESYSLAPGPGRTEFIFFDCF